MPDNREKEVVFAKDFQFQLVRKETVSGTVYSWEFDSEVSAIINGNYNLSAVLPPGLLTQMREEGHKFS